MKGRTRKRTVDHDGLPDETRAIVLFFLTTWKCGGLWSLKLTEILIPPFELSAIVGMSLSFFASLRGASACSLPKVSAHRNRQFTLFFYTPPLRPRRARGRMGGVMAENNCTVEAAESIRARLEAEADRAHFRKTGKHLLPVVSARDLERHPELAVQDIVRPKFTERKVEDRKDENHADT